MRKSRRSSNERVSQPERRKRTQERLLRAAIEILIERGYSHLTMELVSRRAGVSRGAQTNYYPTKRDLLLATANQVISEGMPKPLSASSKTPSIAEAIDAFIDYSATFFLSPRYTAMIELHVAGRHDATLAHELESLQRKSRKAMDDIWLNVFVRTGASPSEARDIVQMTDHFLRGVALLACIQTRRPTEAEVKPWTVALKRSLGARTRSIKP